MRQWRLIYDDPTSGAHNMAVDDAILRAVSAGLAPPTLRLYAWSSPCLSLGYGQKSAEVDFQRVAQLGWDVVRRPTGGRAILHVDELTYSVALPANHPLAAAGIMQCYRQLSQALLSGLRLLGLTPAADGMVSRRSILGPVCFETPSPYEITVAGRKLVGSAQVRRKGSILQHGTLPLSGDLGRICEALAYPDAGHREQAKTRVRMRAVTLSEALGWEVDFRTAAAAITQGFVAALDINVELDVLSEGECATAQRLAALAYTHVDVLRNPR